MRSDMTASSFLGRDSRAGAGARQGNSACRSDPEALKQRRQTYQEEVMRKIYTVGLVAALSASLLACGTNTGTGALIGGGSGAALGAGIGALAGGGKGALIGGAAGAAVGAGTGALIGHYMDKQQKELEEVKAANVERHGDELVVKFNSAILFDTGKADLKPQSQKDLADFSEVLKKYPDTNLVISGHTDNTGKKDLNQKLSEQRAQSVVTFLQNQGVASARLSAMGYADTRPVADNATADGRQQNRRVEVNIAANEELKRQDAAAAQQQQGQQPAPQK
jgi:outer membrane protein OmpA-like peptidoglycan-associated protein